MASTVMPKKARGLYRTPGWAYATDGNQGFQIPEGRYLVAGYLPDYEDLPTKETYEAANKPGGPRGDCQAAKRKAPGEAADCRGGL